LHDVANGVFSREQIANFRGDGIDDEVAAALGVAHALKGALAEKPGQARFPFFGSLPGFEWLKGHSLVVSLEEGTGCSTDFKEFVARRKHNARPV